MECPPYTAGKPIIDNPMSWYSGNQLTPWVFRFNRSIDKIICVRLVPTARCVISTPTGGRVDPEVYCRCETRSMPNSTGANDSPAESGIWSITTTRGRRNCAVLAKKPSTASRAAAVVSTTDGSESRSAVSNRSACPGSSGANSGTAMVPALTAP